MPRRPEERECRTCERSFPLDEKHFYRKPRKQPGFLRQCVECSKAERRSSYRSVAGTLHVYSDGVSAPLLRKRCAKCKVEKDCNAKNFSPHRTNRGGCSSLCRPCSKVINKARYERDKPRLLAQQKQRRERLGSKYDDNSRTKHWASRIVGDAKQRAKRYDLPFDIDVAHVLGLFEKQGGLCYWYGIQIIPSPGKRDPQRPSLDKLEPYKGYVRGNVVLTCMAANMGRNECSAERFGEFAALIREKLRYTA